MFSSSLIVIRDERPLFVCKRVCRHHNKEARALETAHAEAPSRRRPAHDGYRELNSQGLLEVAHAEAPSCDGYRELNSMAFWRQLTRKLHQKMATGNSTLGADPREQGPPRSRKSSCSAEAASTTTATFDCGGGACNVRCVRNTRGSEETRGQRQGREGVSAELVTVVTFIYSCLCCKQNVYKNQKRPIRQNTDNVNEI